LYQGPTGFLIILMVNQGDKQSEPQIQHEILKMVEAAGIEPFV
jgi:hypothetical protein